MSAAMGSGTAPREPDRPATYLGGSVLVTLFCCIPFGIVAITYGILVGTRWRAGDVDGARRASEMAEKWMNASIGAFVLLFVATLLWRVFARITTGKW
jgi:hypothetical protein